MRINRIAAFVLFVISLIVISFKGGPAAYGFFFFTLMVPFVSLVYTLIVFIRFKIYQEIDTKVIVAGNSTPFYFTLQNEDLFTHSGVKIGYFSDFSSISGLELDAEYELSPHTGIRKETLLVCRYRGEYEVGIKSVTVTDYLRLFSIKFKNRETLKVTVMPRLEILKGSVSPDMIIKPSGNPPLQKKIPDIPVRDYTAGDDIRMINWKSTARFGKPLVRTMTGEETPSVKIVMDSCRYDEDAGGHLPLENKILETVLAVSYLLSGEGISVSVIGYNDRIVRFDLADQDGFEEFYRAISAFSFRKDNTVKKLLAACGTDNGFLAQGGVIYVFHEWDEGMSVFADEMNGVQDSQTLMLISDEPGGSLSVLPGYMNCSVIGYEDRLTEVLG